MTHRTSNILQHAMIRSSVQINDFDNGSCAPRVGAPQRLRMATYVLAHTFGLRW